MTRSITNTRLFIIIANILIFLAAVQVAYAINITVDGTRESLWDGVPGQTPGKQTDANEGPIPDGYDVEEVLWTNNDTDMFFGFQTYTPTIWTGFPVPTVIICLDTDNSTLTGDTYSNCNGMSGIDRSLVIVKGAGTSLAVTLYAGEPGSTEISTATVSGAFSGNFNEVSVDLASLNIDTTPTCISTMPGAFYFDNGKTDPDDNTPDAGTLNFGCGSPTAVSLQGVTTGETATEVIWPLAAAALTLLTVAALRRRQQIA